MARRRKRPNQPNQPNQPNRPNHRPAMTPQELRERILADFALLKVPLTAEELDALLAQAEREGLAHLEFVYRLIAEQARQRRERSIAARIREARFPELTTLDNFQWDFNKSINRGQIEELLTGEFIRRKDNLVLVGQSGVGKSRIVRSIGLEACVLGHRVRYTTSAKLLEDLKASLADRTLPQRVRYYARFTLLVIDEFGFDRLERLESPQAANLLYKIIDARYQQGSTALVSNIDFDAWTDYLGDPPLAMALLDRVVDGAIVIKIKGRSYRAHRGRDPQAD